MTFCMDLKKKRNLVLCPALYDSYCFCGFFIFLHFACIIMLRNISSIYTVTS